MSASLQWAGARKPSLRQRLVRLAERVTTPLLPADYLDLFDPLRRGADLRGRIMAVHPETADAATIEIRPGADWAGHVPGQYVRIGVDVDGVRQWRAYSLTHGPRADGRISVTIKAVPDGKVSNHLVRQGRPGTLVHLEQATGDFVLPTEGGRFLFVTAGSGITPVIGMLRNLFPVADAGVVRLARSEPYDIVVLHVAPDRVRLDLPGQPARARRRRPDPADQPAQRRARPARRGRPDRRWSPTWPSGPRWPAARRDCSTRCSSTTTRASLPLVTERFRTERIVVGDGGTVAFARSGTEVTADAGTPILDAAEEAGVLMPSGCRMGICFGCVLPLRSGSVRDLRNGEITTATEGETANGGIRIQTCINAAAGACEIDH